MWKIVIWASVKKKTLVTHLCISLKNSMSCVLYVPVNKNMIAWSKMDLTETLVCSNNIKNTNLSSRINYNWGTQKHGNVILTIWIEGYGNINKYHQKKTVAYNGRNVMNVRVRMSSRIRSKVNSANSVNKYNFYRNIDRYR